VADVRMGNRGRKPFVLANMQEWKIPQAPQSNYLIETRMVNKLSPV
jgi:hypothetical protein